jgi:RHS repeat-associated protein
MNNVESLTYNQADRLATAGSSAGPLAQYTYDAFGHRIIKVGSLAATTVYQYDLAGHLLEEIGGSGTTTVDYIYLGDEPIAAIEPGSDHAYFLHDDRLGTPQIATDASQAVQWTAAYQPFGYASTGVSAIVQDLRMPGQENDLETGLYHNGFRDYQPAIGRFIESDPIGLGGGLNTYAYAQGNPLLHIDRSGLWTIQIGPAFTASAGAVGLFGGEGIAIDSAGNIGSYWYAGPSGGVGAESGAGVSVNASNALTIQDLAGPFGNTSYSGGTGLGGTIDTFSGPSANGPVVGGGFTLGPTSGESSMAGASYTRVNPWFNFNDVVEALGCAVRSLFN